MYTQRLAPHLVKLGLDVQVVAPQTAGEPPVSEDRGVLIRRCYRRGPGALPAAAAAAQEGGVAVVHVQHETFLFGGASSIPGLAPALAMLRRRRLGPVVTLHQVVDPAEVDGEFARLHRVKVPGSVARAGIGAVQRTVEKLAARTVVHEPRFAEVVRGAQVVRMGVEGVSPIPPDVAKAMLGVSPQRLSVLCFGFVAPYKGLEAVLQAACLAGPEIELVVAGGDHPRVKDGYADDLRATYGRAARFTGFVPDEDVIAWFSAADVLVLPYPRPFAGSGPLSIALGLGTPVLCSPALAHCAGAPTEMEVSIEPDALAARLRAIALDRAQLAHLSEATRGMASGRSWESVAEVHKQLYEEVIDANRASRGRLRAGQPG